MLLGIGTDYPFGLVGKLLGSQRRHDRPTAHFQVESAGHRVHRIPKGLRFQSASVHAPKVFVVRIKPRVLGGEIATRLLIGIGKHDQAMHLLDAAAVEDGLHELLCLLWILDIAGAQLAAARRMGVEIHRARKQFTLHRVHRLGLHRDGEHRSVVAPAALSEIELLKKFDRLGIRNQAASRTSFLGAGAYSHYIPTVVDHLISRSEFFTAYTP